MNPIIRQLQIDLITDTPNRLTKWFDDLYSKLRTFSVDSTSTMVFYNTDLKVVFVRDDKYSWFHYVEFWGIISDILEEDYNALCVVSYSNIQDIIMLLFESKGKYMGLPMVFTHESDYFHYQYILDSRSRHE